MIYFLPVAQLTFIPKYETLLTKPMPHMGFPDHFYLSQAIKVDLGVRSNQ